MSKKNQQFPTLILLRGIPGSGKTTWAKEQIRKDPYRTARVSRDDFREMLSNYTFSDDNEGLVSSLRDQAIKTALKKGYNVIVDETHVDKRAFKKTIAMIKKLNINCYVMEKTFYIKLEDALKRNAARDRVVPDHVIKGMWSKLGEERFKKYEPRSETILSGDQSEYNKLSEQLNDESLPKCILVDLDGTISLFNKPGDVLRYPQAHERNPYNASTSNKDYPNKPIVELVHLFNKQGYKIIFCSGREDRYKPQTLEFLNKYIDKNVDYDLYMRSTGDTRKDWLIKEQLLKKYVAGKYCVYFALDDRNMMIDHYRNVLKLNTWQVANGDF